MGGQGAIAYTVSNYPGFLIDVGDRIVTTDGNQYKTQAIIIATGSTMERLGVAGEEKFIGKGVSYYAKRDVQEFVGKRISW